MPFAVVEGEPVTELPRDLYIPPDALQVFLEAFEGPLDLLLYLIRKQNLDILDIPIAEITRQYMKYIEVMADLQLELAGEYLLMAAMLAEIKSRMLLPRPADWTARTRTIRAPSWCAACRSTSASRRRPRTSTGCTRMERDTLPASAELVERKVVKILPQVSLQEMLVAFKDVLSRAEMFAHHHINRERLSVRQRMSDILSALREAAFIEFRAAVPARGRADGRHGDVHRDPRADARRADRDRAERSVRADSRAHGDGCAPSQAGRKAAQADDAGDADAENEAALAQPAQPEDEIRSDEPDEDLHTLEACRRSKTA